MVSVTYEPTDEEIVPYLSPSATYAELKQWIEEKNHSGESELTQLYPQQSKNHCQRTVVQLRLLPDE